MLNRAIKQLLSTRARQAVPTLRGITTSSGRNGGHAFNYRTGPANPGKETVLMAEMFGGFMWWWIFWHFWHEPGHIFGEFPYPDRTKWTDQELGIPADSEE